MNFTHMPEELGWTYGYGYALGLMAAVGLVLVSSSGARAGFDTACHDKYRPP